MESERGVKEQSSGVQIAVLSAIAALILALCAVVALGINANRATLLEAIGIAAVPAPDPNLANRKLKPPDIQRAFGDPENYPEEARDRGEQGLVRVTLEVAASGIVEDCRLDSSSGSGSLDAATCRLARERIRFEPARNSVGEAIASDFVLRVRWQLPDS